MTIAFHGRVEYKEYDYWHVVFPLTFVHDAPALISDLFGVGDTRHFAAVVPERGMPLYTHSWHTEDMTLHEGSFGHTWIAASDIAAIDWNETRRLPNGTTVTRGDALAPRWRTAFKLMGDLTDRYGADHVRMVIWFHEVKSL